MDKKDIKYNIIDRDVFLQREKGEAHTAYQTEIEFYTNIQNGDLEKMESSFEKVIDGGLVLTLLVHECKEKNNYPKALRKCMKYIDNNLHSDLSLKMLSKVCSLSASHISLLFREHLGIPVSVYIRDKRLEEASELINSGMSISAAAYSTGFCSESYFIKCYKQKYAITPGKSRR